MHAKVWDTYTLCLKVWPQLSHICFSSRSFAVWISLTCFFIMKSVQPVNLQPSCGQRSNWREGQAVLGRCYFSQENNTVSLYHKLIKGSLLCPQDLDLEFHVSCSCGVSVSVAWQTFYHRSHKWEVSLHYYGSSWYAWKERGIKHRGIWRNAQEDQWGRQSEMTTAKRNLTCPGRSPPGWHSHICSSEFWHGGEMTLCALLACLAYQTPQNTPGRSTPVDLWGWPQPAAQGLG